MDDSTATDFHRPWYHGSQRQLTTLRAGSSVSQNEAVARSFSHRPALVSQATDGTMRYDGVLPGYLYVIAEDIGPDDLSPHPHPVNIGRWEWLTRREMALSLLGPTFVREADRLSSEEIAELRRRQATVGVATFADTTAD